MRGLTVVLVMALLAACGGSPRGGGVAGRIEPTTGIWRAWLSTQAGELPFGLEIGREGEVWTATIINGPERIAVEGVRVGDGEIEIPFAHYDSTIIASLEDGGRTMRGSWRKTRGAETIATLEFAAKAGETDRFRRGREGARAPESLARRWRVSFEQSGPGVAELALGAGGVVTGTVRTPTGDYRYLEGDAAGDALRLSCFDGAHAFLLSATRDGDGYAGVFESGNWHSETFEMVPDEGAALPDAFAETVWVEGADLSGIVLHDLEGREVRLTDPGFAGRPMVVELMGTWCPNCNDAAGLLVELDARYRARGLAIVTLAFELTGDRARDGEQVRRFAARHGIEYPVLLAAGSASKSRASEFFPMVDRVRSFPTTIFVDASGGVRAVHTGFSGPATGEAYAALRAEWERVIEGMLR